MLLGNARTWIVSSALAATILISALAGSMLGAQALHGEGSVSDPLEFWAEDTDGDGLYNNLWVNVTLDVTVQDVFTFVLSLRDVTNTSDVTQAEEQMYFLPGMRTMSLSLKGFAINASGTDGPYTASVEIQNDESRTIAYPSGLSPPFLATDFEEMPAMAGLPFNDYGVDLDVPADGLFNQLRIQLPVDIYEEGIYMTIMALATSTMPPVMFVMTFNATQAMPGSYVIDFAFSGLNVSDAGVDGPYYAVAMIMAVAGGSPIMVSNNFNMTNAYTAAQFQTRTMMPVAGTVVDSLGSPVVGADITFTNYTDLFQSSVTTGLGGTYSAMIYSGDYLAIVDSSGRHADFAANMTVTGLGPVDFSLADASPSYLTVTITMADLDSMQTLVDGEMLDGVTSMRMMVDWNFGNKDGYVTSEEMSILNEMFGFFYSFDDTDDVVYMDGIFYYPDDYPNNVLMMDLSGPIVSIQPASLISSSHMASNSPISSAYTHTVRTNVTYDTDRERSMTTVTLPPGWIVTAATPDPGIVYIGIGTGVLTIDPQLDPGSISGYVWVDITIENPSAIPPTIEGQDATPDPAEYVTPVLISAWVNDSSSISSVDVDIAEPSGPSIGNFSMTYNVVTGKYEYTLGSYAELGLYLYTIWAVDTDMNVAFASGSFAVEDTTNPVADAGIDANVVNGTVVQFDGSGSTDNFQVDNWTWTFDDGVGAVVLYGIQPSHIFNIIGVYTVTLTVMDTVGNPDTDTMTVTVEFPPKPNPPANVLATQTAVSTAHVIWTAPTQNTDGSLIIGPLKYLVFRSDSPTGTYTQLTQTLLDATQYDDTGLTPGTYYYKIEAVNQWANHSDKSSYAAVHMTDKGSLSGRVESEGQVLAGAMVEVLDQSGTVVNSTLTVSDGTFYIGELAPGIYTVRASKDGYESNEKSGTVTSLVNFDVGVISLTKVVPKEEEFPWMWITIIIVIIAIVLALLAILLKRKKKPEGARLEGGPEASQPAQGMDMPHPPSKTPPPPYPPPRTLPPPPPSK